MFSGFYPVVGGQAWSFSAAVRATTVPRFCALSVNWCAAANVGSIIGSSDNLDSAEDSLTSWTVLSGGDVAPIGANFAQIIVIVQEAAETHQAYQFGYWAGIDAPPWSLGGFSGDADITAEFQGSDDGGVTWFDLRFGAAQPINSQGTATALDYESPPVLSEES
jgi:hypothetical protein